MSTLRSETSRRETEFARRQESPRGEPSLILPPDDIAKIVAGIKSIEFSPYLQRWIENYEKVGQRGRFLWQWCLKGVRLTTLSSVTPTLREHVVETKMLSILYGTLIDDIADREQDQEMLEMATSFGSDKWLADRLALWTGRRRDYLEMIGRIWEELWSRCERYPRFDELESLLRFDNHQTLNAMRYALLVNQNPGLLNSIEHDLYQPHNMQIMFMASVDLSASSTFDMNELGVAREIFWNAQRMGRIGNMLTTWEREVLDRDFTSGVFAHALDRGIFTPKDLQTRPAHEIMSLLENAQCQAHFIRDWKEHREQMAARIESFRSFDLSSYLKGFEELILLHLGSRGLM